MSRSDIKFYLTSSQPLVTQTDHSQSIGGFPGNNEYMVRTSLADAMNSSTDTAILTSSAENSEAIIVNSEIMKISQVTDLGEYGDEILMVERGKYGSEIKLHASDDLVFAQDKDSLFNESFSDDGKQYRCIAIKNAGETTFSDVKVFFKSQSKNSNSTVKIALELPKYSVYYGTASSGNTISVVDDYLDDNYEEEFVGRSLVIDDSLSLNYNLSRQIASFDKKTGTFTFINSLPFAITEGTNYRVDPSPSQRLISGRTAPNTGTSLVSNFLALNGSDNSISINFNNNRSNGNLLLPNEVFYLWFERDVSSNTDKYENNSFIFTIRYEST